MQIASLFARIGLKTDEEKAKSFVRSMQNAKTTLIAVGAAVGTVSAAIVKVTSDALDAAAAFRQFEVETGASAQELQRWQAVAEQTNSSAEAVSSAIRAITSNQEQIRLGQGNISGFQLLGIDPRQDPFQILEQLRERTDGLSQAMKRNVLAQLGIGAGLLHTLELSNDQFDALAGRAFIISPQAIETLAQARASMNQAARAVDFMKAQIAVALVPEIQTLTDHFIEFIKRNEEAFIHGFRQAFRSIQAFFRIIARAARGLDALVRATFGWENALKVALAALALFNASLLLSPIGLITAGIVLLVAVLEDLYVFSQGGQSLFGVMLQQFPRIAAALEPITSNLDGFKDVLRDIFTQNEDVANAAEEWGKWASAIERVVDAIRNFLRITFNREAREEAADEFVTDQEAQREGFSFRQGIENLREGLQTVGQVITGEQNLGNLIRQSRATGAPLLQPAQGNANITNTMTVTVNGADDPRATAEEIMRRQREFNAASAQRGIVE